MSAAVFPRMLTWSIGSVLGYRFAEVTAAFAFERVDIVVLTSTELTPMDCARGFDYIADDQYHIFSFGTARDLVLKPGIIIALRNATFSLDDVAAVRGSLMSLCSAASVR